MFYYQLQLNKDAEVLVPLTEKFIADKKWLYCLGNQNSYCIAVPSENRQEDLAEKVHLIFPEDVVLMDFKVLSKAEFIAQTRSEQLGLVGAFLLQEEQSAENQVSLVARFDVVQQLPDIVGLEHFKKSIHHLTAYLKHRYQFSQLDPIIYIFNGQTGTGRRYAVQFLESLFDRKALYFSGEYPDVPKLEQEHFPVIKSYVGASSYRKHNLWKEVFSSTACPLKVFMVDSDEESRVLEKELAEHFYQVEAVTFPSYTDEELVAIAYQMFEKQGMTVERKELEIIVEEDSGLNNSLAIRQFVQKALQHSIVTNYDFVTKPPLSLNEIRRQISSNFNPSEALEELEGMIGLSQVKRLLSQQLAYVSLSKKRQEHHLAVQKKARHLIFSGNPSTGKTEVARIYTKILYDHQLISKNKIVEVGRADLIGEYVGQTAPKIKRIFDKAEGGVLFIDEAYSLIPQSERDFAQEAIPALIQEMENRRDKVLVIFAGYRELMAQFVASNPGLASRISREVVFDDYSPSELLAIFEWQLSKQEYQCSQDCLAVLKEHFSRLERQESFGNARYVRQIVEGAIVHQAHRLIQADDFGRLSLGSLMELTRADIQASLDDLEPPASTIRSIGFSM